jgi:hypothetical protein
MSLRRIGARWVSRRHAALMIDNPRPPITQTV